MRDRSGSLPGLVPHLATWIILASTPLVNAKFKALHIWNNFVDVDVKLVMAENLGSFGHARSEVHTLTSQ